jgi:hypothetical protein
MTICEHVSKKNEVTVPQALRAEVSVKQNSELKPMGFLASNASLCECV